MSIDNYEATIGIEVHVQLNTISKMFSKGKVSFASKPNTNVNINDLGLPGVLPTVNKKGVELALICCKALNMKIDPLLKFDRKNYYYSDLPKGFQITQYFFPIGKDGYLIINEDDKLKKISIERLHIEEDTAKQNYLKDFTEIDYNRSGIGLVEIVSKPVMHSWQEALLYVSKLQKIVIYNNISDGKMSDGSFRCDINISLKRKNAKELGNKVEIKNLNSLNNIKQAIIFEIKRQSFILSNSKKNVDIETRRFDELSKKTISMRKKTTILDYRFLPEPNIRPIKLKTSFINNVLKRMKLQPDEIINILKEKYKVPLKTILRLIENKELVDFFFECCKLNKNYNQIINYLLGFILFYLNKTNTKLSKTKLKPLMLSNLITLLDNNKISSSQAKQILNESITLGKMPNDIIKNSKILLINDNDEIKNIINTVIDNNLNILNEYNTRPERVFKFYMGQIMKLTKGKINPKKASMYLSKIIKSKMN